MNTYKDNVDVSNKLTEEMQKTYSEESPETPNCDFYPNAELVCEAILKEITRAKRWHTIELAAQALNAVRQMHDSLKTEFDSFHNSGLWPQRASKEQ